MILKLITVKETYELKTDDVKATELLNQIAIRRPEQMITIGKNEGAPYTIGIKPAHLVGYELIPESVQDKAVVPTIVPAQEDDSKRKQESVDIHNMKIAIEQIKDALTVRTPENPLVNQTAKKAGRPKATKE